MVSCRQATSYCEIALPLAACSDPGPYARPIDYGAFEEGEAEEILVILECANGLFLACSYNRGVQRGDPILVGIGEPYRVVYFDGFGPEDLTRPHG